MIDSGSQFTMEGGIITENTAANGGGIYSKGTCIINSGIIENNTTTSEGGGFFVFDGTLTIDNGCEIKGNKTGNSSHGGAIFISSGKTFTMNGEV